MLTGQIARGGLLLALALATPAAAAPPASAFGRIPAIVDAEISPNGQKVAILGGAQGARVLSIMTIDRPDFPRVPLGDVEAIDLSWAGDSYVVVRIALWKQVEPQVRLRLQRNIAFSADGTAANPLLPGDGPGSYVIDQPVLGVVEAEPAKVVLQGLLEAMGPKGMSDIHMKRKGQGSPFEPGLFLVDPATGKGKVISHGDADTLAWDVDADGEPRIRLEIDEITNKFAVFGRAKGRTSYDMVWQGDDYESRRRYFGYSDPDDAVYLGLGGRLVRKRLSDGVTEPVGSATSTTPTIVWDAHRITAVGIASGAERPKVEWLDPELGAVHGALARAFKQATVELMNWSTDRTRFVVRVESPNTPPGWYLFDKSRKELSPLGEAYPELKAAAPASTSWIIYKARDGLEIPAYLTLPPGAVARRLPLVVLPHGGPSVRDDFTFDYLAQFIASRGYAVLQPQYRGSWGFGAEFEKAGDGEWSGKIQTDLLDGIAALAEAGQIDPALVCIVGASFGGYAALTGATLHADAYKCAASIAGMSDLGRLLIDEGHLAGVDSAATDELRRKVGQVAPLRLAATSPARHAADARGPILLVHGDQDTVVSPDHSRRMAKALVDAGKPVELVILEDEDHYLNKAANRTRMLEAIEAFLAKNLPVTN